MSSVYSLPLIPKDFTPKNISLLVYNYLISQKDTNPYFLLYTPYKSFVCSLPSPGTKRYFSYLFKVDGRYVRDTTPLPLYPYTFTGKSFSGYYPYNPSGYNYPYTPISLRDTTPKRLVPLYP